MDSREALKLGIDMGRFICMAYLDDLTDDQLMMRPHPDCNHINWQVGHLIVSEHSMLEMISPGSMPPLPDGFAAKYTKETAASDELTAFADKATLIETFTKQREATVANLDNMTDEQLAAETPEPVREYAPNVAAIFSMQGSHWVMHSGQWVIVRRMLGKPALF